MRQLSLRKSAFRFEERKKEMKKMDFVDAFSVFQKWPGNMTQTQKEEYDFYSVLGDISRTLVDYRIRHDLNQKQLAQMLNVSQSMVSKYESGDYNISVRALSDLCAKLGFELQISIEDKQKMQSAEGIEFDIQDEPDDDSYFAA